MQHLNDADFARIALRGLASLEPEDQQHLDACADCSGEAAAFSSIGSAARSQETLEEPPADLWERIAGELGEDLPILRKEPMGDSCASVASQHLPSTDSPDPSAPHVPPLVSEDAQAPVRRHGGRVSRGWQSTGPKPRRDLGRAKARKRAKSWIAGAAIAGFVLGAVVAAVTSQWSTRNNIHIVEQASLEPLPGWDARGTARVEDTAGRLQLVVDLPDNPVSGFREVWLLDLAGQTPGLLSVGTLNGDRGVFDLPPGVDLTKYNIVDVSHEPFDGNPAHSADSIVRGELGSLG